MNVRQKIRKIGIAVIFGIVCAVPSIWAFDLGVRLQSTNVLDGSLGANDPINFGSTERADLQLAFNFGEFLDLALGGHFELYLPKIGYDFDIDFLTLRGDFNFGSGIRLLMRAGRFRFVDVTGKVLNHKLDGAQLSFRLPFMSAELGVGTTALLFNNNSYRIVHTKIDDRNSKDNGKILAPLKLIGNLTLSLVDVIPRHTVYASALLNVDLRSENELIPRSGTGSSLQEARQKGGQFTTHYYALGINGGLGSIYYNVYGVLQLGEIGRQVSAGSSNVRYQYDPVVAGIASLRIGWLIPNSLKSLIEIEGFFSSGDADYNEFFEGNKQGSSSHFIPISNSSLTFVFAPKVGNVGYGQIRYSIQPFSSLGVAALENFQVSARALLLFRGWAAGAVSITNANQASELIGAEASLTINYRPVSDVGFSLTYGMGLPLDSYPTTQRALLFKLHALVNVTL